MKRAWPRRLTGSRWRSAASLGALMNTRGLMALIVLDIGLNLGVISPTLFAMLVLMALVTPMATAPALKWLTPKPPPRLGPGGPFSQTRAARFTDRPT